MINGGGEMKLHGRSSGSGGGDYWKAAQCVARGTEVPQNGRQEQENQGSSRRPEISISTMALRKRKRGAKGKGTTAVSSNR